MRSIGVSFLCVAFIVPVTAAEESAVVVKNAGFEVAGKNGLPADWYGKPAVYQRDEGVAHTGKASLRFVNSDAKDYALCSQPIRVDAGKVYEISAWVKTKGIKGNDTGATICMEWSGKDGKYLGGAYPAGKRGDTDWVRVTGRTGRIPAEAARVTITCYVRQGMTGTAWWDDVEVRRVREDPLSTVLLAPNYRGEVTDGGPKQIRVLAEINLLDYDLPLKDVALAWTVVSGKDQAEVARGRVEAITSGQTEVVIPARGLPTGPAEVRISLIRKDTGSTLASRTHEVVRQAKAKTPVPATIDAHSRLILDGKPFFPLGMYWGSITKEELEEYAEGPMNCLMPYGRPTKEQMDLAQSLGLKVIFTVKDIYYGMRYTPSWLKSEADARAYIKKTAAEFRDHPALMAWYINDELPLSMVKQLEEHQRWIQEFDPGHPSWVVLYQVDEVRRYIRTFDVIGTDPYPIPQRPASTAGTYTRKTVAAVGGARPVWQVPQVFNWACYKKTEEAKKACRPPTFDEMRSMAWQCIAEGANGLVFYSWFDIRRDKARPFEETWGLVKRMAGEIKEMIPALLSVEAAPRIEVDGGPWLHTLAKQVGGRTVLIAVNDGEKGGTATFRLPGRPTAIALCGSGQPVAADGGGVLKAEFGPLEVRIYEISGLARR